MIVLVVSAVLTEILIVILVGALSAVLTEVIVVRIFRLERHSAFGAQSLFGFVAHAIPSFLAYMTKHPLTVPPGQGMLCLLFGYIVASTGAPSISGIMIFSHCCVSARAYKILRPVIL